MSAFGIAGPEGPLLVVPESPNPMTSPQGLGRLCSFHTSLRGMPGHLRAAGRLVSESLILQRILDPP